MAKVNRAGLKRASKNAMRKPRTSWPVFAYVQTGKKSWALPGSPCYNVKAIDYNVHRRLPAKLIDRNPRLATDLAVKSPRWGVSGKSGHTGKHRVISPPWAAGQVTLTKRDNLTYDVHRYSGDKLGHVKVKKNGVDMKLQKKFKNRGYGVEVAKLLKQKHPEIRGKINLGKEADWHKNPYYYRRHKSGKRLRVRKGRRG